MKKSWIYIVASSLFRWLVYTCALARFLRSLFATVLGGLCYAYMIVYEVNPSFLSEYLTRYPNVTAGAFIVAVSFGAAMLIVKSAAVHYLEQDHNAKGKLTDVLIKTSASAVMTKLDRFKDVSKKLSRTSGRRPDVFRKITNPQGQINLILERWVALLREEYGLQEDHVGMTVLKAYRRKGDDKLSTSWCGKYPKLWKRTAPSEILENKTLANYSLEHMQPVLITNKNEAAVHNKYFYSRRDYKDGNHTEGCLYCYPTEVFVDDVDIKYVISIAIYDKSFCVVGDKNREELIKSIFREICSRIDMELTLCSIKDWINNDL